MSYFEGDLLQSVSDNSRNPLEMEHQIFFVRTPAYCRLWFDKNHNRRLHFVHVSHLGRTSLQHCPQEIRNIKEEVNAGRIEKVWCVLE